MRFVRVLLLGLLAVPCWAQTQPVTQTVKATGVCVPIGAQNNSTVGIIVSGTWSGTFTPNLQISTVSGAPTIAKKVVPVDSTTAQSTVTANGGYRADVSGFSLFNFCSTGTWTSGSAIVTLNVSTPPAASTVAGSSGGTVTGVTGTAPVTSSGGAAPAIGCATCATTGTGVSGDYSSYSGASGIEDSTVVAGPYTAPLTTSFWATGATAVSYSGTANKALLWGFTVPYPITTTKVTVGVVVADTLSCTYDLGILNASGNIVAHIGNSTAAALGFTSASSTHTISWLASGTMQPGKYYAALTASGTSGCATMGASTVPTFVSNTAETVTAGGTLNNGITIPSDSQTFANVPSFYIQ